MGASAPKPVVDLEARDMTEMSDISDRVPSHADRKVFLSGDYEEEQLRAEFVSPYSNPSAGTRTPEPVWPKAATW
jgi:hypothetical protein